MTVINKNTMIARKIGTGSIFRIVNADTEEYFMKLNRERIRQCIKNEMNPTPSEMAHSIFAVKLSNGEFCKLDDETLCCVYENSAMVIKN